MHKRFFIGVTTGIPVRIGCADARFLRAYPCQSVEGSFTPYPPVEPLIRPYPGDA